ncbi:hypothetical protein LTR93_011940 [Exophiala xenobiotica]|nr:hypothetical protein LTR93_011940 [Exophiala xenobiotica]
MAKEKKFDVAIVGGGTAGLTLAIALYHRGVPVTIYEQAPQFAEIGAGVAFGPNAVEAMKPLKSNVWFDYVDGMDNPLDGTPRGQKIAFSIQNRTGSAGVHRAHYVDELVKLIPLEIARFGKKLVDIQENGHGGKLVMQFKDGTTVETDAVIGCDGVKSRVRQIVVGPNHPSAQPVYTHKYAYRGLIPMEQAVEAIGDELALNAVMHMGPGGHILTFPVAHGKILNVVAFKTTSDPWPDFQRLSRPATRGQALSDFAGYGRNVTKILHLVKPDLSVWAIFDLGDHPVPSFCRGRICLVGDAAHATSPHHGAGAGMCIEDGAVLAELLADDQVLTRDDLEAVFATFDAERRERGQWLVQSSRLIGDCYEWRAEGIGKDFAKIERKINIRNGVLNDVDVIAMCEHAKKELTTRLSRPQEVPGSKI